MVASRQPGTGGGLLYQYTAPEWQPDPAWTGCEASWKFSDRASILYAGRVVEQKQPRVFAETMRLLREQTEFTALVAGDGEDLPWLKAFVNKTSLENVRFLGAFRTARAGIDAGVGHFLFAFAMGRDCTEYF